MVRVFLRSVTLALLLSPFCYGQDPMPVLRAGWKRTVHQAPRADNTVQRPARELNANNKYFQRKAREARTDIRGDPDEGTIDARSEALDRAVQESRTAKADDIAGYSYAAEVRNDSGKTVEIVYWEYRFAEIARPTNITRRQFLCGAKFKSGEKRSLSAFSLLGPSDALTLESLAKSAERLFNEEVLVNRIEFSDGSILQRPDWKFAEVKEGVKRATSTPWGREVCRAL
jgi:hypothetical protein